MKIRLQKFLAEAGVASRRASEVLIAEGKVRVNGRVVKEMGVKVDPEKDDVHYDGKIIKQEIRMHYYMLNKPKGYITTAKDEKNRKTVFDLMDVEERLFTVGRLDQATSGMLLLTNDGDLAYKLTHPSKNVTKTYMVDVTPKIGEPEAEKIINGIDIGDYVTAPCQLELVREDENSQGFRMIIHEGKNRQVRRVFEAVGCKVTSLKRTRIGKLKMNGLKRGKYRKLSKEEIRYLKNL